MPLGGDARLALGAPEGPVGSEQTRGRPCAPHCGSADPHPLSGLAWGVLTSAG